MTRRTGARGWSEGVSADNRVYRRTTPTSGEGETAAAMPPPLRRLSSASYPDAWSACLTHCAVSDTNLTQVDRHRQRGVLRRTPPAKRPRSVVDGKPELVCRS